MINVIIVSDDTDTHLGNYFLNCKEDISQFFDGQNEVLENTVILIPQDTCNQAFVDLTVEEINDGSFVFIAYSHGNERYLRSNGGNYIQAGVNTNNFANSLFFTNSCLSGKELGKDLIDNGCISFVGYVEEVYGFLNDEYMAVSINCDNACIKSFFSDTISISLAFERMKKYYTSQIDKYKSLDPIFAARLVSNREALVLYGNMELVKEDLTVEF
ncbi:hypothetical protein [uncultured Draconibacterium sp.]|uniref:hypothetical protein n=1 Tax=uncultured Draconibacterium sp. TaxID=1573823 RepID=UPI002AA8223C|nr:hypothetical protein [uncultured Draconibacterium sp.]